MILNVVERLNLLSILPKEGDYVTLKILRDLRMALGFTEEELEKWEIVQEDNIVNWGDNGEAEIPIGEKAMGIIVDQLRKMDEKKQLTPQTIEIYEKFIPTN